MKKSISLMAMIFGVLVLLSAIGGDVTSSAVSLPEPIGAWNMNDGEGDKVKDTGKLKNDGYFGDGTGWMMDFEEKFSGKIVAPGIVVVDNSEGQYDMSQDFTFATWIYVSDMQFGSWGFIADNYADEPMTQDQFSPGTWTILVNTVGNLCIESQKNWKMVNQIVVDYDMTAEPKWRHIAVTFKRDTLTYEIFIDGENQGSRTKINDRIVNPTVVSKAVEPPTEDHRLRFYARDPNTHVLKGRMAMVRIFDQTLTRDQVILLMNENYDPVSSEPVSTNSSSQTSSVAVSSSAASSSDVSASVTESTEESEISETGSSVQESNIPSSQSETSNNDTSSSAISANSDTSRNDPAGGLNTTALVVVIAGGIVLLVAASIVIMKMTKNRSDD